MTNEEVKSSVRKAYGSIATQGDSCCAPNCGCEPDEAQAISIIMNDKYTNADEGIVAAADLGLGCGTPTAFAEMKEGTTVLDLGSGAGIDVFLASKQVGPTGKAIGVDMTSEMLARANQNKRKLGIENVEFRKGEIENLPVENDTIDHIISNCVINLVPDKQKAFSEMYRVLRIGGKFTISDVVSVGKIPEDIRADMSLWAGCVAGALEKNEYLDTAKSVGFNALEIVSEKQYKLEANLPFGLLSITLSGTK